MRYLHYIWNHLAISSAWVRRPHPSTTKPNSHPPTRAHRKNTKNPPDTFRRMFPHSLKPRTASAASLRANTGRSGKSEDGSKKTSFTYNAERVLGSGSFGVVYQAQAKRRKGGVTCVRPCSSELQLVRTYPYTHMYLDEICGSIVDLLGSVLGGF